jgi:hypothetical protein
VKPGSVVFIPRGYWHETDTFGESLALTFMIDVPTWRGRILHELRRRLEPLAAWRGGAMATQGGPAERAALVAQLGALLPQLQEIVGSLRAESVIDSPLSDRCYRWPAGERAAVVTTKRGRARHLLRMTGEGGVREATLEADMVPVAEWLCARQAPWSVEQVRAACPSRPASYVDALLAELTEHGFVEPA